MRLFSVNEEQPEERPSPAPYADFEVPLKPEGRPYTAINMVMSLDGRVAVSGKSGSIGSETDRLAMRNLRAAADAVVVGAGSLRAEKMSLGVPEQMQNRRRSEGRPHQPLAVIVGGSRDLPLKENLIGFSPENTLILLPQNVENERRRRAESLGRVGLIPATSGQRLDLRLALGSLSEDHGVNFALVEGGPSLNHELVARDLADDLFLTISPRLLGGSEHTIIAGDTLPEGITTRLLSVHKAADELFLRYRPIVPPPGK